MKSNLDGRNVEKFIDGITSSSYLNRMEFPEGIAIDWVARNIYWTDSGKKTIEVARLDDGRTRSKSIPRVILFDEQIQNPRGIAVHPSARFISSILLTFFHFDNFIIHQQYNSFHIIFLLVVYFGQTGIDFIQESKLQIWMDQIELF